MPQNPVHIPQAKGIVVDTRGAEIVAQDSPAGRDSRGIYLPHYIEPVSHIAIDIGGSLAKVVYFTRSPNPPNGHSSVQGLKKETTGTATETETRGSQDEGRGAGAGDGAGAGANAGAGESSNLNSGTTAGSESGIGGAKGTERMGRTSPLNGSTSTPPYSYGGVDGNGGGDEGSSSSLHNSWNPIINGALTPDLLTSQRQSQRMATRDIAGQVASALPHGAYAYGQGQGQGQAVPMSREGSLTSSVGDEGRSHYIGSSPSSPVEGQQRNQNRWSIASATSASASAPAATAIATSASTTSATTAAGTTSTSRRENDPTIRQSDAPPSTSTSTSTKRLSRLGQPRAHHMLHRASLPPNFPGGTLNFVRFETEKIEEMIAFLKNLISMSAQTNHVTEEEMKRGVKVLATGGGAHKFYDILTSELGVPVTKEDEMECLITGLGFITCIPDEVFWYSDELVYSISHPSTSQEDPQQVQVSKIENKDLPRPSPDPPKFDVTFDTSGTPQFPCLLVNIGSGVSIVKVDEDGSYERVSGTSVGGGTLWGLLSLLTDASSFDEMLEMSERGDNAPVDMLVGDIYGSDYSQLGLKSSMIASSFGKVFKKGHGLNADERRKNFRQEDISKSLLYTVSNNIGQIAYMNAEKYGLDRIYFGGCFIRGHAATISTLSYAIRFWSRGTVKAMFLRHEGFLGSIGAWIKNVDKAAEQARQQQVV